MESAILKREIGYQSVDLFAVQELGVNAVHAHGIAAPGEDVALRVGVIEVDDATLADHRIIVEVLLQSLPKLHRPFVERDISRHQVVGADDRSIASGIARPDPIFLQYRDLGDAVVLGEIIRCSEAVPSSADDHHVIVIFRHGITPSRSPFSIARERIPNQR